MADPIEYLARREGLGLGQPAIAEVLGISQSTWARYEGGSRSPADPVAVDLVLAEWEEYLVELTDELVEQMEHASGVQDSPVIEVRTYKSDKAWWAVDARAARIQAPAQLHRVAVARAAALVRMDQELKVSIVSG